MLDQFFMQKYVLFVVKEGPIFKIFDLISKVKSSYYRKKKAFTVEIRPNFHSKKPIFKVNDLVLR